MKTIVNIDVPAIGQAVEFYCAALGLRLNRMLDEDVAELVGASSIIYLLQQAAGTKTSSQGLAVRDYARHWTPVHIDFVVEDVEEAAERAEAAGAIRESECIEWRGSKCITFSDPFGHGFCLIEFTDETYT